MAAIIFLLIFVLVSISNLINGGLIMNVNTGIKQAVILAIGIIVLGFCVKSGLESVIAKDRKVVVKGLAEKEVEADKVTWPIVSKEIGNDLPQLYKKINATTSTIRQFLLANGVKASEINVNAPVVIDLNAERYGENRQPYRYNITSIITVTSRNVKVVRGIIARQGDLLQKGVAIVDGGYENPVKYEYVAFREMKPKMMQEAIENAEKTAAQFAENSKSKIDKIMNADQGQFSIEDRDQSTPYVKKVRVVTTIVYSLKD